MTATALDGPEPGRPDDVTTPSWADVAEGLHTLSAGLDRFRTSLAAELDLSTTDVAALVALSRRPGQRPGELAPELGVGVAATTSVIDKLVRSGFARRNPDPTDRRSTNLTLTPAGQHAVGWVSDAVDACLQEALGTGEGLALAARLLDDIGRVLAARAAVIATR